MMKNLIIRGRVITEKDISFIRQAIESHWGEGRTVISQFICQRWGWVQPNGRLKDMACREMLRRLEAKGLIKLPPPKRRKGRGRRRPQQKQGWLFPPGIDVHPIEGDLHQLQPIELRMVRWREEEKLYRWLIDAYHYLGYCQLPGAHLKYIAFSDGRPLACLGWGGAAWKVASRDNFIGWSESVRPKRLHLVTNNNRFLIPPWVKVPHLASHLLALNTRVIAQDWEKFYSYRIVLLETFVEKERFRGTCYRAANWIYLGQTKGRGKYDRYGQRQKSIKSVFVYPLRKDFRGILNRE